MAWTSPRTWAVSEFVTAALLNTHVRDNLLFLKSDPLIGVATSTTTVNAEGGAGATTVLTISSLAIPADVGAVYVEAWAAAFGHSTLSATGWAQVRIEEATAGILRRGGNTSGLDQRYGSGHPGHYAPLYMRTQDLAWAGTTRTLTLKIEASSCQARIVAASDSGTVMRVMRSY